MQKWLLYLLLMGILAFLLYRRRGSLRRRLRVALWVALIGYGALFVARLVALPPQQEQLESLALIILAMAALWLAVWAIVSRYRPPIR